MKNQSKLYQVVSIGDLVVDVILSIPQLPVVADEHQILHGLQLEPGGAGNFLVAGARLGMVMTALAAVGEDTFARSLLKMLGDEGVGVDGILHQAQSSTTTVFVLEDDSRKHVFLGQYGQGPNVLLSEDWKMRIASADAVQLWGYSLNEERMIDCVLAAAAFARQQGRIVIFDPGPLLASAAPEHCQQLVKNATVILSTEDELTVLGQHCQIAADPRQLLKLGPSLVCVKHGQDGCVLYTRDKTIKQPGFKVPVVDTNAAGDSFMAAFVYAYLSGWPLEKVAVFANAMGAAKVQKFGSGRQVPTAGELRKVLRDFAVGVDF
ncbi:MAG: carbohydrate kinase family protein [Anaerolineaceae bacterium]|nr:carbohydrate kinase family protein [Anaerolineaceae bacterium]